jgi:endonuclease YncB( thermonuclease family)
MSRSQSLLGGIVAVGVLAALCAPEVLSQPLLSGEATVIDGDTLDLASPGAGRTRIRIAQIDAPEVGQMCGAIHCGLAARGALADAIQGALVTCKPSGLDPYGRTLAQCATKDIKDLGAHLVGAGYARSYVKYGDRYRDAEDAARAERLGLWRTGSFGAPEDWRRGQR